MLDVPAATAADWQSGLASPSAEARWSAARAAGDALGAVDALAKALSREVDGKVREAIFTALARIATPESIAAAIPFVRSDDAGLRTGALDVLRAQPALAAPHLAALLADPDSDVRLLACDIARGASSVSLLCGVLERDPQPNVCAAAVEVLAEIGDADTVAALTRCRARFPDDPFLAFAIDAASNRLGRRRG
jgi:HEAT repeat protein